MWKDYQSLWKCFFFVIFTPKISLVETNIGWLFIDSIVLNSFKAIIFIAVYVSLMYIIMLLTS